MPFVNPSFVVRWPIWLARKIHIRYIIQYRHRALSSSSSDLTHHKTTTNIYVYRYSQTICYSCYATHETSDNRDSETLHWLLNFWGYSPLKLETDVVSRQRTGFNRIRLGTCLWHFPINNIIGELYFNFNLSSQYPLNHHLLILISHRTTIGI